MGARGPKGHEPTKATRELVKMMVMSGATQEQIIDAMEITKPTLHKHYRRELDAGMTVANAQVAGKLFNLCMEGNPTAIIWWEKTRMGMKEKVEVMTRKPQDLDDITRDMSDEEAAQAFQDHLEKRSGKAS